MAAPRNDNVKEKILDAATGLLDTQTFADISLAEIAAAAGVSARALSGGFSKYVGVSPRAYLNERRLHGVRRELAGGAASVASAAHAWGYVNLGSFAASYRRRFGENPSQTLRGAPHI